MARRSPGLVFCVARLGEDAYVVLATPTPVPPSPPMAVSVIDPRVHAGGVIATYSSDRRDAFVVHSVVIPGWRRHGVATKLYRTAAWEAHRVGAEFWSDTIISFSGEKLWLSFVARGWAAWMGRRFRWTGPTTRPRWL